MVRRKRIVSVIMAITMLVTTWGILAIAAAQKAAVPKPQDKLAIGEDNARQLLLLIDTDKNGKISKQEWMRFMEAEFDRLDKAGNGQLDLKELGESQVHVNPFLNVGK
jgi:EF hand domain-containing protein